MSEIDQQFIEYIVKSIVGKPDAVKIERRIDEKGVLLELTVDAEDLGRVIGKRGATAQSLRTLLRALGTKNDARYNLKIIDVGEPPERRRQRDDNDARARDDSTGHSSSSDNSATDDTAADEPADTSSSNTTTSSDDEDDDLEKVGKEERDHSDVISKTRAELAELDDLDV